MKIVQIIRNFSAGGGERFAIHLSNQLYIDGNNVTIIRFSNIPSENFLEEEVSAGVNIITIQKSRGMDFSLVFKLFKLLKKINPDVVHTHLNGLNYCLLSILFSRKPFYFHTIHSMPLKEAKTKADFFFKKMVFRFDLVSPISISNEVHQDSLKYYGSNVKLIFNGIKKPEKTKHYQLAKKKLNEISHNNNIPVIINIGSFRDAKNHKMLIEIINELNESEIKVKLLIIGGNKKGERFNNLKKISDPNNIYFLGSVINPTDYLIAGDYFCLSSLWEGMPLSLIEAFGSRCLSICTPAGGISSMIKNGHNGLLAENFKKNSLKKLIIRGISLSESQNDRIKENAYNDYQDKYDIKNCSATYLDYFKSKKHKTK